MNDGKPSFLSAVHIRSQSESVPSKTVKSNLPVTSMKSTFPLVRARVTLLPEMKAPKFGASGTYRPHLVLGPIEQRSAILDGHTLIEDHLGVALVGGPEMIYPGETAEVELALMYYPNVTYAGVQAGATFTVREGPVIVGFGTVLTDVESPKLRFP